MDAEEKYNIDRSKEERFLDCAVCLEKFQNPVLTPCGHAVCAECFEGLRRAARKKAEKLNEGRRKRDHKEVLPMCPICRDEIIIGDEELLPKVRVLGECMDYISKSKAQCTVCGKGVLRERAMCCWDCVTTQIDILESKILFLSQEVKRCSICKAIRSSTLRRSCLDCNRSLDELMKREIEKELIKVTGELGGLTINDARNHEIGGNCFEGMKRKLVTDCVNVTAEMKTEDVDKQEKICSFCPCKVESELFHLCGACLGFQSRNRVVASSDFDLGSAFGDTGKNPFSVSNTSFCAAEKKGGRKRTRRFGKMEQPNNLRRKYAPLQYFLNTGAQFTLHDEDIRSMKDQRPLTDSALGWGLCTVCTDSVVGLDKVEILQPANSHAFRLLSAVELEDAVRERNLKKKLLLLMPINDDETGRADGGRHWTLLAYFSEEKRFVFYDSMHDKSHALIARTMAAKMNAILNGEEGVLKFSKFYNCAIQTNGVDCGAFVIAFVKLILESYHPYDNPECDLGECSQRYVTKLRNLLRDQLKKLGR